MCKLKEIESAAFVRFKFLYLLGSLSGTTTIFLSGTALGHPIASRSTTRSAGKVESTEYKQTLASKMKMFMKIGIVYFLVIQSTFVKILKRHASFPLS